MKFFLIICFYLSLVYSNEKIDLGFKYGMIAQLSSNSDSTISISDSSIVSTGDKVRLNIGYLSESHFIVIFKGSKGEFWLAYSSVDDMHSVKASDSTYVTAVPFSVFEEPSGFETFYLINSIEPFDYLIKIMNRYEKAPLKAKAKLANRIQAFLDEIDPLSKGDLATVQSRLDRPMVGGVSFRGEKQVGINPMSLTHVCHGSGSIIFKKIILNHISR